MDIPTRAKIGLNGPPASLPQRAQQFLGELLFQDVRSHDGLALSHSLIEYAHAWASRHSPKSFFAVKKHNFGT
jgi:hypothetical protein